LSRHTATLIFEALATGCISTSAYLSIHNMNSWILDLFGTKEQIDEYLPGLMTMDLFSSYLRRKQRRRCAYSNMLLICMPMFCCLCSLQLI